VSGTGTFVTHDGLALSYRLAGNGPLLVCQPGGPGRASSYLRDLAGLTEHRTLVLLDSRGTGSSERPQDPEKLNATYVAEDLESLREHLGLETFELLGHSAGAVVT
jgi:pimeloyl-ACP methyl ester carboxylesterase